MARRRGQKKQTEIDGTERPHDEEISAAIEDLKDLRTQRTDVKGKLDAASERLQELMVAKGLTEYIDAELRVKVTLSDKTQLSLVDFNVKETTLDEAAE